MMKTLMIGLGTLMLVALARPELQGPLERGREARGDLEGHLGDRAGRRFMPADRDPRPAARGRQRRALRRLDDDPLRPEDAAGNRAVAHDAWLAALLARPETGCLSLTVWVPRVGLRAPLARGGSCRHRRAECPCSSRPPPPRPPPRPRSLASPRAGSPPRSRTVPSDTGR